MGVGQSKTLEEQIKENKRNINKAIRELDRERKKLERQEKKIEKDIKKAAKENQMEAVKIMAKDYIRTKNYKNKFYKMRTQLQGVALRIQTMKSTQAMTTAMKGATRAMIRMNQKMNLPQMQHIMRKFAMETERMDMTQEMMGDTIDDVMESASDEEEEEKVVDQVLTELGIDTMEDVPDVRWVVPLTAAAAGTQARVAAPIGAAASGGGGGGGGGGAGGPPPAAPPAGGAGGADLSDLEARLNNLRK